MIHFAEHMQLYSVIVNMIYQVIKNAYLLGK